jgi:hypothetical protein
MGIFHIALKVEDGKLMGLECNCVCVSVTDDLVFLVHL